MLTEPTEVSLQKFQTALAAAVRQYGQDGRLVLKNETFTAMANSLKVTFRIDDSGDLIVTLIEHRRS